MPYYEYECELCGKPLTRFMPVIPKTVPDQVVDICSHGENVSKPSTFKRVMSMPNFHLKGKGWGKDGYVNPTPGMPSGEAFVEKYREELADPEHPRQVGDLLKQVGRKNDDYRDMEAGPVTRADDE